MYASLLRPFQGFGFFFYIFSHFISESGEYETPSFPLSSDFKSIESSKTSSSKEKKIQKTIYENINNNKQYTADIDRGKTKNMVKKIDYL